MSGRIVIVDGGYGHIRMLGGLLACLAAADRSIPITREYFRPSRTAATELATVFPRRKLTHAERTEARWQLRGQSPQAAWEALEAAEAKRERRAYRNRRLAGDTT